MSNGLKWDRPGIIIALVAAVSLLLDLYGPVTTAAYMWIFIGSVGIYRWWIGKYSS